MTFRRADNIYLGGDAEDEDPIVASIMNFLEEEGGSVSMSVFFEKWERPPGRTQLFVGPFRNLEFQT